MKRKHKTHRKHMLAGFTIIELLVVISIISLLSSILLVSLVKARQKSRDVLRYGNRRAMVQALQLYYQDNGSWPATTNPANLSIPGNTWYCLGPAAEACWVGVFHGDDPVATKLAQYLQSIPTSYADQGTYAYNRMIFSPHQNANFGGYNELPGAYLTWAAEQQIPNAQCPSQEPPLQFDKYWYCTEYLGQ